MKYQERNSEFHLRPAELQKIIDAADHLRDRLIVEFFVYTGLRRAELQKILVGDVDLLRRRLVITQGKGGKQRIVYLAAPLLADLSSYCAALERGYLFAGRNGKPMSLRNINYVVTRVAAVAGVANPNPRYKNVGPHLIRHSFARNWKRVGGSLESLQRILGHASLKTTLDIYGSESQTETEDNYHSVIALVW